MFKIRQINPKLWLFLKQTCGGGGGGIVVERRRFVTTGTGQACEGFNGQNLMCVLIPFFLNTFLQKGHGCEKCFEIF